MSKLLLEVETKQLESWVQKLPLVEKIRLAQRLSRETWQARFKALISSIDRRLKKRRRLSDARIVRLVKNVRKNNYAKGGH